MHTSTDRDADLVGFSRSIVEAAVAKWGDGFVTELNAPGNPVFRYTETHYALAATLLGLLTEEASWFDVAAKRLEIWDRGGGPMTFFNSMAVCLTVIELDRARREPDRLRSVLRRLVDRTVDHEQVAFRQWCGNNAYLQQVTVDAVLAPLARREEVRTEKLAHLVQEFRRFRTPEGFFFDLPRVGTPHERLCPPAYVMKMLFLAGVGSELTGSPELGELFVGGMSATLPLLTEEGQISYFGRTDNSPFGAALTLFNLRRARSVSDAEGDPYGDPADAAKRYFLSFPRTPEGLLRCNRFRDPETEAEYLRSHDHYAYVGQYSLASCAYALMAARWLPPPVPSRAGAEKPAPAVGLSEDLGVARISDGEVSLVVRTSGQVTSRDRRYFGPTILRFRSGERVLVGAPPTAVSSDPGADGPRGTRLGRLSGMLRRRAAEGFEQLDGTTVGFVPVLRSGRFDYVPGPVAAVEAFPSGLRCRYEMVRLEARGWHPAWVETEGLLRSRVGAKPRRHVPPRVRGATGIELIRVVTLEGGGVTITDTIAGQIEGMRLVLSVRSFPGVHVSVDPLSKRDERLAWGSDGRQRLVDYVAPATNGMEYTCRLDPPDPLGTGPSRHGA